MELRALSNLETLGVSLVISGDIRLAACEAAWLRDNIPNFTVTNAAISDTMDGDLCR